MSIEALVLLSLFALILVAAVREVYCFVRWKREISRMERNEWARVIRLLRE